MNRLRISVCVLSVCVVGACSTARAPQSAKAKPPAKPTVQNTAPNMNIAPHHILADTAMRYLGTPYRYGGNAPHQGFDCSGLVAFSAQQALNLQLPRRAVEQAQFGQVIDFNQLQVGDLLFFNTSGQPFSHVGIYIGQTHFIHAPSSGGVVRIDDYTSTYWRNRHTGTRRL